MQQFEHINPTEEITLETVKKKATRGVLVLTGRTFFLNAITLIAQGFLWSFLGKYEFGVFWVVSAIINFLTYFSDIGLAGALVQKKEEPSDEDLRTTFVIQESLVIFLIVLLFIFSPLIAKTNSLTKEGIVLMYALGISFFLSSLKSIPSVLLERKIDFTKFVIPQIVETLIYNVTLVAFAWKGFGISSFTYSVLIRGIVGVLVMYWISPWKPGFALSVPSLKSLLKFGLPYQVNSLLATLKDDGMVIILGSIVGPAGIGVLGTAQKLSQYPLRFFMDHVTKVTFPAFARMQGEKDALGKAVTKSIFFICFLVMPSLVGIIILAPLLMVLIPGYGKWRDALMPLNLISVSIFFAAVSTQLTNVLNAIGKIKITFFFMVMWTVLTFIFVPVLALRGGVNGAAFGYLLVGLSSIITIVVAKKYVNYSFFDSAVKPLVSSLGMGAVLILLKSMLPPSFLTVGILITIGVAVYAVIVASLLGIEYIRGLKKNLEGIFTE